MDSAKLAGRVTGLAAIAALSVYSFLQPAPLLFKAMSATLVIVSVVNPAWGLLVFAGVAPLSIAITNTLGGFGLSGQLLEQTALALGAGVILRGFRQETRTRIGGPAALVAAVAVASAATLVAAGFTVPVGGATHPPGRLLAQLMDRRFAQGTELWAPLFASAVAVASALIGWAAERTGRQHPELVGRIVAVSLVGYAAAALWNIEAIIRLAALADTMVGSLHLLVTERISRQTDVHSAASAFLLAGLAGAGLLRGRGARKAAVVVLLMLLAAGLWITGSRVAIAAGVITAMAWATWALSRGGRWRLVVPGIAIAVIAASIWVLTLYPSSRYNAMSFSIGSRAVLLRAGLQMVNDAPVFGIGVTRFYRASEAIAGPDLERLSFYKRENAHNNFLQVVAEQGLVGLAAMIWWLSVVLWCGWRAQAARPDPLRGALLVAIVACIGTWLTGHPLLVPEFSIVFWLYSGLLLATTPAPPTQTWTRWIVPAVIVIVLASVPLRTWTLNNAAELEHIGSGLSLWQHDDEQRYREAGASFAIYLPATDGPVVVPMRRAPGAPDPIVIDVRIRGAIVSTITLRGDAWQAPAVHVSHRWRRFELAEFAVRTPPAGNQASGVLLRAGKAYQPPTGK